MVFFGILIAVCSSITYASFIIACDRDATSFLPIMTKQFFYSLSSFVFIGIPMVLSGKVILLRSVKALLLIIAIGLSGIIGMTCLIYGINKIGATVSAFFNMLEPITSLILSTLLYKEYLSIIPLAGCGLVILSMLLIALDSSRRKSACLRIK